jgi:hypothetical protein
MLLKLRLTNYMTPKIMRLGIVFLLAFVLLAGLFHFCPGDRASESSRVCQVCATTGTAIVSSVPTLTLVAVLNRLEILPLILGFTVSVSRTTAPRAPPAL